MKLKYNYITCKKFRTLKIRTFYFGSLIFGHFFSYLGQISDQNFGLKHAKSKFTLTNHELD